MSCKDTLRGGGGGKWGVPFLPLRCLIVRKVFSDLDHFGARSVVPMARIPVLALGTHSMHSSRAVYLSLM